MDKTEVVAFCRRHMHKYVVISMTDGSMYDGIVEHVDEERLYLAVPIGDIAEIEARAFDPFGFPPAFPYTSPYSHPYSYPFPYTYPYMFGYHPDPRFRRLVLPIAGVFSLSVWSTFQR
ncbi:hypothetical protein [Paenibacillus hamazuiensis]|uniref:hypothetical protein n=1 Tax=Paenibacillus hamazuiensis TaxID=2936508 RepID=UPI00200C0BB0|nr:hypothetical protein [Paenibacillus hamazuiensis]